MQNLSERIAAHRRGQWASHYILNKIYSWNQKITRNAIHQGHCRFATSCSLMSLEFKNLVFIKIGDGDLGKFKKFVHINQDVPILTAIIFKSQAISRMFY